jgi:hypothetical protein
MSSILSDKTSPSYESELSAFTTRLLARREAEKYAPWHPKNIILHPRKTCKLAFGLMSDEEMEKVLAHMDDSGTAGSKDKPNRPPKPDKKEFLGKFWN